MNINLNHFYLVKKARLLWKIIFRGFIIYPSPSNINYLWNFGFLSFFFLLIQILTGIFLAMVYTANINLAFFSVEYIMREINTGWLIRYLHSNGAAMFFLLVYIHIIRSLLYGSYSYPRELLWVSGVLILVVMIVTGFLGYVLPWGQMSFWAATVITSILSAIPSFGYNIVQWIWGGYSVNNATLTRFFSFHYLFPFLIFSLVIIHILFLHEFGSNNPLGIVFNIDNIALSFTYLLKDLFFFFLFCFIYLSFVFFYPDILGHSDNYIQACELVTPAHIVPEWYFWPYYTILRSVSNKLLGVLLLFFAIIILLILPFFLKPIIRNFLYFPVMQNIYIYFFCDLLILAFVGGKPMEYPFDILGKLSTFFYFFFFFFFFFYYFN